jgi:putative polyketide hydroxylase
LGFPADDQLRAVSPSRVAVFPQDQLEAILLNELRDRGGQIWFATELIGLVMDEEEVTADHFSRGGSPHDSGEVRGGGRRRAECRPRNAGHRARQPRLGGEPPQCSVPSRPFAVMPGLPHVLIATVAPGAEGLFVTTGQWNRWMYDLEWHPEAGETLTDWPSERLVARLRAAAGLPDLALEILGVFPWDFGAAVARRQRPGRAFLVGLDQRFPRSRCTL